MKAPAPPAPGVSDKSCDAYLFWDSPITVSQKFKRALKRLTTLKAKGVDVYFAWPVVAGDACLSDTATVNVLVERIEREVEMAGFEFLGRPAQNIYPLRYRDDSPYHLIKAGTDIHTKSFIEMLQANGIQLHGQNRDLSAFARLRLYELESNLIPTKALAALPIDQPTRLDDPAILDYVDFAAGWWAFEPYGRWMRDNEAALRLHIPKTLRKGIHLQISGTMAGFGVERANIILDGQVIGGGMLGEDYALSANLDSAPRGQDILLKIRFPESPAVLSPHDRGVNADKRTMTFHLKTIELTSRPSLQTKLPGPPPQAVIADAERSVLILNQSVSLAAANSETLIEFGKGWWDREPAGRWMSCCEATFSLRLPPDTPPETVLEISGDVFGGGAANVEAVLNGVVRMEASYSRDTPLTLPLDEVHQAEVLEVILKFPDRVFESPKALGIGEDVRVMSGFVTALELSTF